MVQLIAAAARVLPVVVRAAPQVVKVAPQIVKVAPQMASASGGASSLASKALPYLPSLLSMGGGGGGSEGGSRAKSQNCECCECGDGGKGGGKASGPSGGGGISAITDAIKSVSDSFTSTIVGAGQALSSTVSTVASGATSVVGNVSSSITTAVSTVAQGVTALTASLGPVGAVIGGIASAASAVTGAIMGVASAVATSVLAIGTGVVNVATTIVTTVVSLIGTAVNTCATFISTIAGLFSVASAALSVVGTVATAVAGVFAGIANAVGSVIGALTSIVSGIVSTITSVVGALTAAFKSISESLGQLAGIAGEALGGLIKAVNSCVDSLTSFARTVTGISNHTGMSTSQASGLVTDLQVLGVSEKVASQTFASQEMRPELFNARSNATGLAQMGDRNFWANEARLFQDLKAKIGLPAATERLKAQFGSQYSEEVFRVVNMDPAKLQANLNYGRQVQGKLGINDGQIKSASEDLPLLMARVSTFIDTVKVKFAAELLPSLEAAFSVVSNVLQGNAGNISSLLQSVTRTIFVDGPDMAANAALTVIGWASSLADMFFDLVDAGISMMEAFGQRDGVIYNLLLVGANFIDSVTDIGAKISGGIAFIQALFESNIHYLIRGLITAMMGPLSMIPGAVDKAEDAFSQFIGFKFEAKDPFQAYQDEVNNRTKFRATDTLNNRADSITPATIKAMRDGNNANRIKAHGLRDSATVGIKDANALFGTAQQRDQTYNANMLQATQRSVALQESQLAVSQQQLDLAKSGRGSGSSSEQIIARMSAYLAQDAYRLTSR